MCALRIIKNNSDHDQKLVTKNHVNKKHKVNIHSVSSAPKDDKVWSRLIELLKNGNFEEILHHRKALKQKYAQVADLHTILGIASIKSNRPDQARIDFEAALKIDPKNNDALKNLANMLQETRSYDAAMHYYKLALKINNDDADVHFNMAKLNSHNKNIQNAIQHLKEAISIDDEYFPAYTAIGELYLQDRLFSEAETYLRNAIALKPNSALALFALAKVLFAKGEIIESDQRAAQALNSASCNASLVHDLGVFYFNEGSFNQAKKYFESALLIDSRFKLSKIDLCSTLVMLRDYKAAKAVANELIAEDPNLVRALNVLALCYEDENQYDKAEKLYKRCIELDENDVSAHTNLAVMYSQAGERESSKRHYKKVIELAPNHVESFRQACDLLGAEIPKRLIIDYETKIKLRQLPLIDLARAHFALSTYYKAAGNTAKYLVNLKFGNAARKSYFGVEFSQMIEDFSRLKFAFEKASAVPNLPSKLQQNIPIFVVGMPRSGTTLIEQILSSHSKVSGAGELKLIKDNFDLMATGQRVIDQTNLNAARNEYLAGIANLGHRNQFVVDKMPHNFYFIGVIAKAFPEAKIIYVKRDKRAVCWSNYATYFITDGLYYSYDLNDCLEYYDLHEDLMQYWKNYFGNRIHTVDYDKLTDTPDKVIKEILLHTGLAIEPACFKPELNKNRVLTASSNQVRRPIYRNSSNKYAEYKEFIQEISPNFFD